MVLLENYLMYDVIIVGAGIAGSVLGDILIKEGLDVLIIEKNENIKIDSGIVAARNIDKVILKKHIKKYVRGMSFISPSGITVSLRCKSPFACILKRRFFGRYVRNKVKSHIVFENVIDVKWKNFFVEVITDNNIYYSKIVIGCDGACSIVRKKMSLYDNSITNPNIVFGALSFDKIKSGDIKIYFNKEFSTDFFSWSIPSNNEYGLISNNNPYRYMEFFSKKIGFSLENSVYYPIAVGSISSFTDRALLVGESAGYTKPITGGGIDFAITSAKLSSTVIMDAIKFKKYDKKHLSRYNYLCRGCFGKEIEKQLFLRKIYSKINNTQIDELFTIIKKDVEKISFIEDYIELSNITKNISKGKLLLWGLKNITTLLS